MPLSLDHLKTATFDTLFAHKKDNEKIMKPSSTDLHNKAINKAWGVHGRGKQIMQCWKQNYFEIKNVNKTLSE